MTRAGLTALLMVVYVATIGSLAPLDLLAGAAFGAIVAASCGRRPARPSRPLHRRLGAWPRGVAVVVREIVDGGRTMLRVLVGLQRWRHAGIVEVSTARMNDREAVIAAWVVTASPGSLLLRLDRELHAMTFHVIDARDPAAFRRDVANLPPRALRPEPAPS